MGRRLPRPTPETAQVVHQREAFLGALRGRSNVPIPVGRDANSLARSRAGGASASAVRAYQDEFVLAGGEEEVELTYLPLTYSEHTYLNGVYQREGDDYDWTRESGTRTVTVKAAMDARAGDVLIVEYLYYAGTPVKPTPFSTLPAGPKYWYKLDETGGTVANDSSGNDLHGSFSGTYTLGASAVAPGGGTSISVNGGGLNLCDDEVGSQQAVSFGAWINMTGTTGSNNQQAVFYGGLNSLNNFDVWANCASPTLRFGRRTPASDGALYTSSIPIGTLVDGDDHLLVTVATGTQFLIYLDGELAESGAFTETQSINASVYTMAQPGFVGRIDQVAGWERQLTEAEIAEWWGQ